MNRELTCIICPRGCSLTARIEENQIRVTGNACPRGEQYAIAECTNPLRTVTAVLRVANRCDTMICVKTEQPVPKAKMPAAGFLRNIKIRRCPRWKNLSRWYKIRGYSLTGS